MKSHVKATILAFAALVIASLLFISSPGQVQADLSEDPLNFPVLLIHGLGEAPGEGGFGKMEQYLEGFFYEVESLDFNDYKM